MNMGSCQASCDWLADKLLAALLTADGGATMDAMVLP